MKCLFLGGPWDGTYKEVEKPGLPLHVPVPNKHLIPMNNDPLKDLTFKHVTYVAVERVNEDIVYFIYVREGMKIGFG